MTSTQEPVPPGYSKDHGLPTAAPPEPSDPKSLNVGLFPYVPMPSWFESEIKEQWKKKYSDFALNFVQYDCYKNEPSDTIDVFAFDTIFTSHFIEKEKEYLTSFSVEENSLQDYFPWAFIPWALSGLQKSGTKEVWALPYLGCMSVLIYRADDDRLWREKILTVTKLQEILGTSKDIEACLSHSKGVIADFTDGTTLACLYLQTVMQNNKDRPRRWPSAVPNPCSAVGTRQACQGLATVLADSVDAEGDHHGSVSDGSQLQNMADRRNRTMSAQPSPGYQAGDRARRCSPGLRADARRAVAPAGTSSMSSTPTYCSSDRPRSTGR